MDKGWNMTTSDGFSFPEVLIALVFMTTSALPLLTLIVKTHRFIPHYYQQLQSVWVGETAVEREVMDE